MGLRCLPILSEMRVSRKGYKQAGERGGKRVQSSQRQDAFPHSPAGRFDSKSQFGWSLESICQFERSIAARGAATSPAGAIVEVCAASSGVCSGIW
jgi:hypothetical protein